MSNTDFKRLITMKYSILLIVLFLVNYTTQGQINKGKKLVAKGDFEGAIEAFENDLEKYTSKPISLQELSKIYANQKYDGYNIEKAYQYITRALKEYDGLNSSNRKKVQSKGVSKIGMSKYQNDLVIQAASEAITVNKLDQTERFLQIYKTASKRQIENITKLRDKLAFEKAKKENTFAAYEAFFKKHEISCEQYNRVLLVKAQKKLLESYIAEKDWKMYPSFEEKYRDNVYVKDSKAAYALIKIVRKNSLKEYQNFTEAYPHSPFNKFAEDYMYDIIMKGTSLPDYDYFVRAYPDYEKSEEIWLRFYRLYLQEHGSDAAKEFASSYPNYPFQNVIKADVQEAQNKKDKPIFEEAKKEEDILKILAFIQQSPSSPFIVDLENAMYNALKKKPLFRGAKKFLKLYPNSKYYDEVLDILYDQYVKDGELVTINQFMMEYPEYKNIEKQQRDLKLAEQGAELNLAEAFESEDGAKYEAFIKAAAPKERAFVALQRMLEADIQVQNWTGAQEKLEQLSGHFGANHAKIQGLKKLLSTRTAPVKKTILPPNINSKNHEYIPLISVNNKFLYFCRLDVNYNNQEEENIYVSTFEDGNWQEAKYLEGLNTPNHNEGPLAISADNRQMIIFKGNIRNGDMLISEHTNKGWTKPEPLPNTINTPSWDADAMISSDGKALLYVSERKEVLDLKLDDNPVGFHGRRTSVGNRDIFVSLKDAEGNWQEPINLGDIINTPFVERTPFLHPDMKTLYFSSDGHGGFGRLDVYKTTRLDDTWQNWSTPVNLGRSINTTKNDWGYRVSTDGKTAYFAATGNNNDEDIFHIGLPREYRPTLVSTISGRLMDMKGNPIEAEIVWEDIETGQEVGRLKSNHATGDFFIALPNDRQYSYFVFKDGYFPKSNHVDLRNADNTMVEINEQFPLVKIDEMVENNISLPLKNLFFETNKYNIKTTSYLELNRLVDLIKKHNLTLKIFGHTDNVGNSKDNLTLSQNRADAVKNYLVDKGCKASKIEAKGYGATKPVAENKTEDGRAMNRRVEVRFGK